MLKDMKPYFIYKRNCFFDSRYKSRGKKEEIESKQ